MIVGTHQLQHDAQAREATLTERVDALYVEHHRRVYALALNFGGGDHAWAEDVTQDAFFTLLARIGELSEGCDPWPWLRRVTINRCISQQRRHRVRHSPWVRWLLREQPAEPQPELELDVSDKLRRVWAAAKQLPSKQRAVFALRYFEDQSQTAIAKTLGYSEGYVSKLLRRAQERVRALAQLEDDNG
ncbi:MAG: RNA polymerase sigma factor [Nannocystales bacterium]